MPGFVTAVGWRWTSVPAATQRSMSTQVEQRYAAMVASGELIADPVQQTAIQRLAAVQALVDAELISPFVRKVVPEPASGSGGGGWGGGWFASKPEKPKAVDPLAGLGIRGLYLWGGVGCGKTMMMDMFFECAPDGLPKRRVHFHAFMLEVHQRVHDEALRRSGAAVADRNVIKGAEGAAQRGLGGVTPEQASAAMSFYHQRTQLKNETSKKSDLAEDDVVMVARQIAAESRYLFSTFPRT
jgi:hypothetical protein